LAVSGSIAPSAQVDIAAGFAPAFFRALRRARKERSRQRVAQFVGIPTDARGGVWFARWGHHVLHKVIHRKSE